MFEELSEFNRLIGANAGDTLRALRPGGPLDRIIVTTVCENCSTKVEKSARWFHEAEFRCACGGAFRDKEVREFLKHLVTGDTRPVEGVRFISEVD
jgi:hypothetical protein